MSNLLTYELAALVGRTFPPVRVTLTEEAVQRYCRAVGHPWPGPVPRLVLAHLGAEQAPAIARPDGLSGRVHLYPLPVGPGSVTGMAWEFGRRPVAGETLTLQGRLAALEEDNAPDGPALVSVLEITYTDANGAWVATQRCTRRHR